MSDRRYYQNYAEYMIRDALFGDSDGRFHEVNMDCYIRAKARYRLTPVQEEWLYLMFRDGNKDIPFRQKVDRIADHYGVRYDEIWGMLHAMERIIAQERGLI